MNRPYQFYYQPVIHQPVHLEDMDKNLYQKIRMSTLMTRLVLF